MSVLAELSNRTSDIFFWKPTLQTTSPWSGHIAFGRWLTANLEPEVYVELGVYAGTSFSAICETVKDLKINCQCFGIDNWVGDEHGGYYMEDVFNKINELCKAEYDDFAHLIRAEFDDAVGRFDNGSIDLLHIDGFHSYEAVKNDFYTWLPKMSDKGIVMFHDVTERREGFGVWKFWEELESIYPNFLFPHSHGLGALLIGDNVPSRARELFEIKDLDRRDKICEKMKLISNMLNNVSDGKILASVNLMYETNAMSSDDPFYARAASILSGVAQSAKCLEIGPLYRPLVLKSRSNVLYADHCDTNELKAKYAANTDVPNDQIVDVDIVIGDNGLSACARHAAPFDAIIASHVIEHVPDLVGWLRDVCSLLRNNGRLCLAVPDKRYTFDFARRLTCSKDVSEAHQEARKRPSLDLVCDAFRNSSGITAAQIWDNQIDIHTLEVGHPASTIHKAIERFLAGEYVDVHCWIFDPISFVKVLQYACQTYEIPLRPIYFRNTLQNEEEFHVQFQKYSGPNVNWSSMLEAVKNGAINWSL